MSSLPQEKEKKNINTQLKETTKAAQKQDLTFQT